MKKSRMNKIKLRAPITLLCCVIGLVLFGCEEKESVDAAKYPSDAVYNPNQPVVIDGFSPEEGGIPTQFIITGSNFGSDTSMIKITIDDVVLPVISSDGTRMYAFLGQELSDDPEKGVLTVTVGNEENRQSDVAAKKFNYLVTPYVTTVAGWISEEGNTSSIDGPIGVGDGYAQFAKDNQQFGDISWMALDQDRNLYIIEEYVKKIRRIPNTMDKVETFYNTTGLNRFRSIVFTNDYKQIYLTVDDGDGNWSYPGTVTLSALNSDLVSNGSSPANTITTTTLITSRACNGGDLHPFDQTYFYTHHTNGILYKYSGDNSVSFDGRINSERMFQLRDVDFEFGVQFHPSGEYAYIIIINKGYIMKSKYNPDTKTLEPPTLFASNFNQPGYQDGVGISAKLDGPWQGAFVGDDFYVCDRNNHCIRKITKDGVVSTFAGRPGESGYDDGALRDARFYAPTGIVYDDVEKCFYVGDRGNARIRKIVLPKND